MIARLSCLRDERGAAMMLVVFAMGVLAVLGTGLISNLTDESKRSGTATNRQLAFQAAEAGLDDYLAKLVDNRIYYLQYVHPGESTRRDTATANVVGVTGACTTSSKPAPVTWAYGRDWTPPNGKDRWCQVSDNFEYNLQITPPQSVGNTTEAVRIVATGRKIGSTIDQRSIETYADFSSVADYQMLSDASVTYGSDATTTGKIYSANNICHNGIAYANLYAENAITCTPTLLNGAVTFNSATIPTPPKGTNFAALQVALVDVQRAADVGGILLDDYDSPLFNGWRVTFQSTGTVLVQSCIKLLTFDLAAATPICGGLGSYQATRALPTNGAIYATKTVIISGPGASGNDGPSTVNGRVTVASGDDIVIAGNIGYVNPVACACGDDVLGMVAQNSVYVANWAPNALTWRGASLARLYQWRAWECNNLPGRTGTGSTMTYYGSTITNGTTGNPDRGGSTGGGCMSSYDTRYYNYDETLLYLPPPWFPTIDTPYTFQLFRELPSAP
ncbi:MAG: hypothetical protein MSC30_13890 [Gaiellaceae bacterium MAG52_C11]|nr:hypothetical protein [Candidatus Gaiellasilicea maunaloa]